MITIGIDIGLSGGLADGKEEIAMPTYKRLIKAAVMVQKKDGNGKPIITKTGPNKGQKQLRIKTKAKYARELDVIQLFNIFREVHVVVFESPGNSRGNSARATKTTMINYGKLLALAEAAGCKIYTVSPQQWKKDLGLSKDKHESIAMCEKLTGRKHLITHDGLAEAFLIRHWFMKIKLPQLQKEQ